MVGTVRKFESVVPLKLAIAVREPMLVVLGEALALPPEE